MVRAIESRTPITFRGDTALYTERELREMRALEDVEDGSVWAAFVHKCKALLAGEFIGRPDAP